LFTIPVLRYMKTYGLTHEQLAMVSVVQREWAAKNPRATFKAPITVEHVLNSRMIAYPFRLLQCCLVTDGGGALILVAAERARDLPQKPIYLLGTGESVETPMVSPPVIPAEAGIQKPKDSTSCPGPPLSRGVTKEAPSSRAFRVAVPTAVAEVGYGLKDLGFAPRGEERAFIAGRNAAPASPGRSARAARPGIAQHHGGGLSYMHSGMYGARISVCRHRRRRGGRQGTNPSKTGQSVIEDPLSNLEPWKS
jgi:acetyl-CoA acetyltransferase